MSDPIQVGGSWKCDLCGQWEDGSSYHNCPAQQAGEPSCMQLKGWKCAEPDNEAAEVPAMCPKCQEAYACGHCGGLYYALSTTTVAQPAGSLPRWTVTYNIVSPESGKWIGTGWEFFDEEANALACYKRHQQLGNCPTKRPFYRAVDAQHLGVVHGNHA